MRNAHLVDLVGMFAVAVAVTVGSLRDICLQCADVLLFKGVECAAMLDPIPREKELARIPLTNCCNLLGLEGKGSDVCTYYGTKSSQVLLGREVKKGTCIEGLSQQVPATLKSTPCKHALRWISIITQPLPILISIPYQGTLTCEAIP